MFKDFDDKRWGKVQTVLGWVLVIGFIPIGIVQLPADVISGLGYFALAFVVCPKSEAPVWAKLLLGFLSILAL
jgi:hypothetical protein